jgi:regulator of cell morphogenesis and NO signaling
MTNDLVARHATVGEIAANLPGATTVFRRFGLDFCCKGNVALDEAARRRGVDLAQVEGALSALDGTVDRTAAPTATPALIDHILSRYHETHRGE